MIFISTSYQGFTSVGLIPFKSKPALSKYESLCETRRRGYKTFFMLNWVMKFPLLIKSEKLKNNVNLSDVVFICL